MGRKGSKLIPFFKNALANKKYKNLRSVGTTGEAFILYFPRKTNNLDEDSQRMLKDWYELNGNTYIFNKDYSTAQQGMKANIRQSDFIKRIPWGPKNKFIYCLLNAEEIKEKKRVKKEKKKMFRKDSVESSDYSPSSVQSSGYGSGIDSPLQNNPEDHNDVASTHAVKHDESNRALLHALEHDHEYMFRQAASDGEPMEIDKENLNSNNDAHGSFLTRMQESNKLEKENSCLVDNLKRLLIQNSVDFNSFNPLDNVVCNIYQLSDSGFRSNSSPSDNSFSSNSFPPVNAVSSNNCPSVNTVSSYSCPPINAVFSNSFPPVNAVSSNSFPPVNAVSSSCCPPINAVSSNNCPPVNAVSSNSCPSVNAVSYNIFDLPDTADSSNNHLPNNAVGCNINLLDNTLSRNSYIPHNNVSSNSCLPVNTVSYQPPSNAMSMSPMESYHQQDSPETSKGLPSEDDLKDLFDIEELLPISPEVCNSLWNELSDLLQGSTKKNSGNIESTYDETAYSMPQVADEAAVNEIPQTISDETQKCKIYVPCNLDITPGVLIMTCQPKYVDSDVSNSTAEDTNFWKLVFDASMAQMVSKYILDDIKLLANDHLLVILKCKELIDSSPNTAFLNKDAI